MKGILASDIDHTLTDASHYIPEEVENFLREMEQNGWGVILLTGRTFAFASKSIGHYDMPFLLGVQNGAEVFDMPKKKRIEHNYLGMDVIETMEELCSDLKDEFIIYSGSEGGDFCYYRPGKFTEEMLIYLEKMKKLSISKWVEFEDLSEIQQKEFPLVKCLGFREEMEEIRDELLKRHDVTVCIIEDPWNPGHVLLLVTHRSVDKGKTLKNILKRQGWEGLPLITAGDDENDVALLELGSESIAMRQVCPRLCEVATIIEERTNPEGIICALKKAMNNLGLG